MSLDLKQTDIFPFHFGPSFSKLDLLLLVVFAVVGYAGFSRFPSYSVALKQAGELSAWWILAMFTCLVLLVFRKIRGCYLNHGSAFLASILISAAFSVFGFLLLSVTGLMQGATFVAKSVASLGSLATLMLTVQTWFACKPDVAPLRNQLLKLKSTIEVVLQKPEPKEEDFDQVSSICHEVTRLLKELETEPERIKKAVDVAGKTSTISQIVCAMEAPGTAPVARLREVFEGRTIA
ncbi:hypothetical protein KX928_18775 [Roseobacter sp. YSTF-M11]|uniref:Uncharacterized protein n=1 Tax=Roseobacter insulae TaxID=2859783 RepID=A0A9X1FY95_9RHOB|nr:hypothetical protein [Roseobacter insulae]MBW4709833.1 hypothetical protein [Roseobacter insulae]